MEEHKKSHKGAVFIVFGALTALAARLFIFSPQAKENRKKAAAFMVSAKDEVMKQAEHIKEMNEDKFKAIVDEVTDRYARLQEVGPGIAKKTANDLKKRWREIYVEVLSKKK